MNFRDLGIDPSILKAIDEVGYTEPTPIQQKAIPPVMAGRDLLGCAQTGTGKTAAFSIPILQRMGKPEGGERPVRALILTPTRELALQIYENLCQYGRYTGRVTAVIYGGVSQLPQVEALRRGADILVATPGRLWDLMGQKLLDISKVECFVLDEADRMLDMGFINDVKKIIKCLPQKRQTLLFSATMPEEIAALAKSLLHRPVQVSITPAATPVELIEQGVYFAEKAEKRELLKAVLRQRNIPQTLIFTRTKHGADRVARDLNRAGIPSKALHGDKSQGARQTALKEFKECRIACLVATDIAARGLDISELPLVINFDLPNIPETYVHRIGRTGRAGQTGTALSFCAADERPYLKDIEKLTGVAVPALDLPEVLAESERLVAVLPLRGRKKAQKAAEQADNTPAQNEPRKEQKNIKTGSAPAKNGGAEKNAPKKQQKKAAPVQKAAPAAQKKQKNSSVKNETAPLAQKYPRPQGGADRPAAEKKGRSRRRQEDLSMDIMTPRRAEIPAATLARIQAKVAAKLAERAQAQSDAKKAAVQKAAPSDHAEKAPVKAAVRRSRGRGRGRRR